MESDEPESDTDESMTDSEEPTPRKEKLHIEIEEQVDLKKSRPKVTVPPSKGSETPSKIPTPRSRASSSVASSKFPHITTFLL
jgi:hypothetical protein